MLIYNNKPYTVSEDIQYKRYKGKSNEPGYAIYCDNQTYHIKGLAAILFDRLNRFEPYDLFDEIDNLVNPEKTVIDNRHIVNMIFLSFLRSRWIKENNPSDIIELEISPYTYFTTVSGKHYVISFLYNTIDLIAPQVYEQVMQGEFNQINPDDLFYLYVRKYIKNKHLKENNCFAKNPKNTSLVYLIFSYACNLQCPYCFEMGKNRAFQMDDSTLNNTLEYIERLSGKSKVVLTFYGGEPLLEMNSEKMMRVIDRFMDNKNIRIRFITNGVNIHKFIDMFMLIRDRLDKFVITVDGTREIHDKRRIFENSQGTFDMIMNNISMISVLGYPVSVRLNVDYSNYNCQEELLQLLNNMCINKENIEIEYHRIEDKSNSDFVPVTYLDCFRLYQKAKQISKFKVKYSVPLLVALENVKEHENGFADLCNTCCSMNRNYVIDLDGAVYSCNEAMGIQDFRLADVRDEFIITPKIIEKNYCSCPFFFACFCNCSLKKYYDSFENKKQCEYSQIEELIHYFVGCLS